MLGRLAESVDAGQRHSSDVTPRTAGKWKILGARGGRRFCAVIGADRNRNARATAPPPTSSDDFTLTQSSSTNEGPWILAFPPTTFCLRILVVVWSVRRAGQVHDETSLCPRIASSLLTNKYDNKRIYKKRKINNRKTRSSVLRTGKNDHFACRSLRGEWLGRA